MTDLRAIFEDEFAKPPSSIEEQAAIAALGEEYPAGLETYSWVSRTELRLAAQQLARPGVVVDVGCGRGGPGIWIAGTTGSRLVGIDIAESALARARDHAVRRGVEAEFRIGTFEASGLPDATADLLVSFDAFVFTPDKAAAFAELARVLRPGARLVMTSWDFHTQPDNRPPQVDDHRPLAEAAGLRIESYEESADWRHRCVTFADLLLARAEDLAAESGDPVEDVRAGLEDVRATIDCMSRRFVLVAAREV